MTRASTLFDWYFKSVIDGGKWIKWRVMQNPFNSMVEPAAQICSISLVFYRSTAQASPLEPEALICSVHIKILLFSYVDVILQRTLFREGVKKIERMQPRSDSMMFNNEDLVNCSVNFL